VRGNEGTDIDPLNDGCVRPPGEDGGLTACEVVIEVDGHGVFLGIALAQQVLL
jgi:hypothetical protein